MSKLLISFLIFYSSFAVAFDIIFEKDGKFVKKIDIKSLVKSVGSETQVEYQRKQRESKSFNVLKTVQVLKYIYGDSWVRNRELVVTTLMKINPVYNISLLSKFDSYLAFSTTDHSKFQIIDPMLYKIMPLSPMYLFWEKRAKNFKHWLKGAKPSYTVFKFNIISKKGVYYPSENSSVDIMQGYKAFKRLCIQCHNTETLGGSESSRRHIQTLIDNKQARRRFIQYIINPSKFNKRSKMPRLDDRMSEKFKLKVARNITNYLDYITTDATILKFRKERENAKRIKQNLKLIKK